MSRHLKVVAMVAVIAFQSIGCFAPAEPTPIPTATPDIGAMVKAAIAALDGTATPAPAPTATPTPRLTYTPFPTPTLRSTNTPLPTPTPVPTSTARPHQQPTQPINHWSETGNWYRDLVYENLVNADLKALGYDPDARFVALDSVPTAWASEIYLMFGCIAGAKVAYFLPYSLLVPPEVDTYVIGIWDTTSEAWMESDLHYYYDPLLTDDESGIYVPNQAQVKQMFSVIQKASRQQNQHQALNAGMFAENDESISFWGEFDVSGLQDVVAYLPCF